MKDQELNPGSPEAYAAGCRCPILDNAHGKGSGWGPSGTTFWTVSHCPLHGKTKKESR